MERGYRSNDPSQFVLSMSVVRDKEHIDEPCYLVRRGPVSSNMKRLLA